MMPLEALELVAGGAGRAGAPAVEAVATGSAGTGAVERRCGGMRKRRSYPWEPPGCP